MKRRILSALMALAMVAGLMTGCSAPAAGDNSSSEGTSQAELAPVSKDEIKVGFVYISDSSDMGYTYNHELGTKEMQEALGLRDDQIISKYNVPEGAECDTALRELAESGCNIIFATSFGYEDYVKEVAAEYPDVQFCHATGYQAASSGLSNFHNYFASIYEARYLAGIAAGLKTETNKLGYVAAYPFAEVISGYTAFYLGAKSVCPSVTMKVQFVGSWSDATEEANAASALCDAGCVMISQHSDNTTPATMAQSKGAFHTGYNNDMTGVAPDASLIGTRIDWAPYFEYAIETVFNGGTIDQDWCKGIADGSVVMTTLNEKICAKGTAEKVAEVEKALKDGTLQVFDTSKFTVKGETVTHAFALDTDGDFTPDSEEAVFDGAFHESYFQSAPSFQLRIDGITELN